MAGAPLAGAKASRLFAAGSYTKAIRAYDDAIIANPADAVLYCNRAAANAGLELHRRCLKDASQAVECDAWCLRAYILKGDAFLSLGKTKSALKAWNDFYRADQF